MNGETCVNVYALFMSENRATTSAHISMRQHSCDNLSLNPGISPFTYQIVVTMENSLTLFCHNFYQHLKKKLYPVISTVEVSHKIITKRARAYDLAGNMRKSWYPVSESMSLICVEFELTHNSHTNTASSYETYAKYPLAQSVYSNNLCAVDIKD